MFLSTSIMNFNHKKNQCKPLVKTFHQNVKECRDVIVKKVSEQGRNARRTQHTPFVPHSALTIRMVLWVQSVCDV